MYVLQSKNKALRWSALGLGLYWGYSRHNSLTHFVAERTAAKEKTHYEDLVNEAKIAFESQYNKEQGALAKKQGIDSIDANSFKFDAEKWINFAIGQSEK